MLKPHLLPVLKAVYDAPGACLASLAIRSGLDRLEHSDPEGAEERVRGYLVKLLEAGCVERRQGGCWGITEKGTHTLVDHDLIPRSTSPHDRITQVVQGALDPTGLGATVSTSTGGGYTAVNFKTMETLEALPAVRTALVTAGFKVSRRGICGEILHVEHPGPNWLVYIGTTGNRTAYLNIPVVDAKRRWIDKKNEGASPEDFFTFDEVNPPVEVFYFHDEFQAY